MKTVKNMQKDTSINRGVKLVIVFLKAFVIWFVCAQVVVFLLLLVAPSFAGLSHISNAVVSAVLNAAAGAAFAFLYHSVRNHA